MPDPRRGLDLNEEKEEQEKNAIIYHAQLRNVFPHLNQHHA
jgi:hypothetical protein